MSERGYLLDYRPQQRTRVLLGQVQDILDEYANYLPLTIRQVFYRLVGTVVYHTSERDYTRLCYRCADFRRADHIAWSAIRDDGTTVAVASAYDDVDDFRTETLHRAERYRRDRQEGQPQRIELWCEAAGLVEQFKKIAYPYSIPIFSSGGFVSWTAIKDCADRAVQHGDRTLILHVGDYDPSGVHVYHAFVENVAALVEADDPDAGVEAERVAVTREQIEEHELTTAIAKASKHAKNWTGPTAQVEAFAPDVLARIVHDAISQHVDTEAYDAIVETETAERDKLLEAGR